MTQLERWTIVDPEINKRINITPADVVGAVHGARKALMVFKRNAPLSAADRIERDVRILLAVENVFAEATERITKEAPGEYHPDRNDPAVGEQVPQDALVEEGESEPVVPGPDQGKVINWVQDKPGKEGAPDN